MLNLYLNFSKFSKVKQFQTLKFYNFLKKKLFNFDTNFTMIFLLFEKNNFFKNTMRKTYLKSMKNPHEKLSQNLQKMISHLYFFKKKIP